MDCNNKIKLTQTQRQIVNAFNRVLYGGWVLYNFNTQTYTTHTNKEVEESTSLPIESWHTAKVNVFSDENVLEMVDYYSKITRYKRIAMRRMWVNGEVCA